MTPARERLEQLLLEHFNSGVARVATPKILDALDAFIDEKINARLGERKPD